MGDCANINAWLELKSRLESRLILSAGEEVLFVFRVAYVSSEIGQALLQRHEAYVRRHEVCRCAAVLNVLVT